MNLKNIFPFCMLGLALSGFSASAAPVFQYTDGDLILDFSETGYPDLEVDIGSLTNLTTAAKAHGGSVTLSGSDYNISSQLIGNFGSVDDLSFTVFGLQFAASNGIAANTVWLTQQQTGASSNTPPSTVSTSKQYGLVGAVQSIVGLSGLGILDWSQGNLANATNNTANVVIIPSTGVIGEDSYTEIGPSQWSGNAPSSPPIANTTADTFDAGGSIISDLFEYDAVGPHHSAGYVGYFTFNSDGSLTFSIPSQPSPPSTVITFITKSGSSVNVNFNTALGVNYSLFYSTNLNISRSSWTSNAIPAYAGTGSTGTLTDTAATSSARFYTVESHY